MSKLFKNTLKFEKFIKVQLFVLFVVTLSWSLVLPIVTKLQGLFWTTSMISVYLILHKLSVFIMPLFKNISLKKSYEILIILDVIYMLSMGVYFYDIKLFIYTEAILMVVYGLSLSIFSINYKLYIMKSYNTNTFKDTQYAEQIIIAIAGIVGYTVVIFIEGMTHDMNLNIKIFMIFIFFNLLVQFNNYKKYWKSL